jgi:DNA-binding response OmpR family regulator
MLRGISGADLAKRVRGDALTNALPLLMLTARSEEPDVLKSFGSGIDE